MEINPLKYGLSERTQLKIIGENRLAIQKIVKSRIIQKDAIRIIEIAKKIKDADKNIEPALLCNRNICSKSIKLLNDAGIAIIYAD